MRALACTAIVLWAVALLSWPVLALVGGDSPSVGAAIGDVRIRSPFDVGMLIYLAGVPVAASATTLALLAAFSRPGPAGVRRIPRGLWWILLAIAVGVVVYFPAMLFGMLVLFDPLGGSVPTVP